MTWLTLLQAANYLIPLLIIPYIVRVLGADNFGKISYAQNIISYLTLLVNYGFEYSATREIAIHKEDKRKVQLIFWSVIKQKSILLFIAFLCLFALFFLFPKANEDFQLYLFVFLINLGVVLFPTWFFQGIEQMGKMAIFNFAIKLLGLILTFIFVKSIANYLLYPLILSLSYVIFGFFSFVYVVKNYKLNYYKDKDIAKNIFRNSTPIFLNNLFVSLYTVSNITIFGLYYSDYEVGLYMGVYKIIMAVLMLTSMPINMSLFPRISAAFKKSEEYGKFLFVKSIRMILPITLLISFAIFIFSAPLVRIILGAEFENSILILKYLSVMPVLVIVATMLTVQGMYGMGLQKYAPYIGFSIGFLCVIINFIFIPKFGMKAVAFSWITAQSLEIIVVGALLYIRFKRNNI